MSHPWPLWLRWTFGEAHWVVVSISAGAALLFLLLAFRHRPRVHAGPRGADAVAEPDDPQTV